MKYSLLILLLFICFSSYSKEIVDTSEINRNNYFNYFMEPTSEYSITIKWLKKDEIISIINEELSKKGYKIITNVLYQLENDTFIVLPAFDTYNKTGYFYQDGHGPCKNDRSNPKIYWEYIDKDGISTQYDLSPLPDNIIVFKEDWYWYQEVNSFNNKLPYFSITKEIIIKILKEDINYYFQ